MGMRVSEVWPPATLNPKAIYRGPITGGDGEMARVIAGTLHLIDCCASTDIVSVPRPAAITSTIATANAPTPSQGWKPYANSRPTVAISD